MRTINVPSVSEVARKTKYIEGFKGVDYASSPLETKEYRATDMQNLMLIDGVMHKRNGAREVGFYTGVIDVVEAWDKLVVLTKESVSFNDKKFKFPTETSTKAVKKYGDKVYVFTDNGIYEYSIDVLGTVIEKNMSQFATIPIIAVGGTVNTYSVALDEININCPIIEGSKVYYGAAGEENVVKGYYTLVKEKCNYCQQPSSVAKKWFKFSTEDDTSEGTFSGYEIPLLGKYATFVEGAEEYPKIEINSYGIISGGESDLWEGVYPAHPEVYDDGNGGFEVRPIKVYEVDSNGNRLEGGSGSGWLFSICYPGNSFSTIVGGSRAILFYISPYQECKLIVGGSSRMDELVLNGDEGENNITIEWYSKIADYNSKYTIDTDPQFETRRQFKKATISAVFGSAANENRLFLASGNYVYYSDVGDFTSFPEGNVIQCGAEGSPITAMMKIADGTLAVSKKVNESGDKSIYYISPTLQTKEINGNSIEVERFIATTGATGYGAINDKCMVNFCDDYVFLAKQGLFGITIKADVSISLRFMRERSRTINPAFLKKDLSNACCFVFDNRLYVSDGERTYVADARYRYTVDEDMDDTYNYEWFVFDVGALNFFERDGKLGYVSSEGRVFVFDDGYADSRLVKISGGVVSADSDGDGYHAIAESYKSYFQKGNIFTDTMAHEITEATDKGVRFYPEITDSTIAGQIEIFRPVCARWESPYIDLGTNYTLKTLKAVGVGFDPSFGGELVYHFSTVHSGTTRKEFGHEKGIDVGAYDFGEMTFSVNQFARNNVWRVHKRNVNYVRFGYESNTAKDCSVNNVMFEFIYTKRLRGTR